MRKKQKIVFPSVVIITFVISIDQNLFHTNQDMFLAVKHQKVIVSLMSVTQLLMTMTGIYN